MDVTSDKNLFDFIENLGKEEVNISAASSSFSSATPVSASTTNNLTGIQPDDIWRDILLMH